MGRDGKSKVVSNWIFISGISILDSEIIASVAFSLVSY